MSKTMRQTHTLVGVAVLAAASLIISFFSFPLIPAVPFLKMDFGDIPILLGMFAYGPGPGIAIAGLRSLLHYFLTMGEGGFPIGDLAAFIASISLTLPLYYSVRRFGDGIQAKVIGTATASISLTLVLSLLNYFVLIPTYQAVMNLDVGPMATYLVGAVLPFNLARGIIVSIVFFLIWRVMQPWMERRFSHINN